MCFNQPISFAFGVTGTLLAILFYYKYPKRIGVAIGIFYFSAMEYLQTLQYFWADKCDDFNNQFLTYIGYLHISFQPMAVTVMTAAFDKTDWDRAKTKFCYAITAWGAFFFWLPVLIGPGVHETNALSRECLTMATHDWIRSNDLCTHNGQVHLAWHIPMANGGYWVPNSFIHFFCMFIQYFLEFRMSAWVNGLLSLAMGPLLAAYLSPSVHEQASIWCYLSIFQILFVCGRYLLPEAWCSWCHKGRRSHDQKLNNESKPEALKQ
eukprot:TRINITY_DN4076_c0_g1_i2.p1 TRINITY_DN4076_c0_g1~~TRINITY_DN4076_c0_g1_i2.p1  ORF type:complete len:265 (+),score=43.27 TRINITY_DN4076_c0_g1_i2:42-836(+)